MIILISAKIVFRPDRRDRTIGTRRLPARPRSGPTKEVPFADRHTHMAKQVIRSRDMEEEVRKREAQNIAATSKNPLSTRELNDQLGVCLSFERGRRHRRKERDCRVYSRLQILEGCF